MNSAAARACFTAATEGFVTTVSTLAPADWGRPGLGEWTVRDLVGHTSRSLTTIETYLKVAATAIVVHDPLDYILALQGAALDSAAIVQRGRDAGAALGADPAAAGAAIGELARRVTALVAVTPDDATLTTVFGGATLQAYLPTRTFELTVHTLDLVAAIGAEPPPVLAAAVAACVELAGRAAGQRPDGAAVLLALTGRRGLPDGYSIV